MSLKDVFKPEIGPSEEDLRKLRRKEEAQELNLIRSIRSREDTGRGSLISPGVGLNIPGVSNDNTQ